MRKILLFSLLVMSSSYLFAQTELTLNSESSINAQIEADRAGGSPADVYIVEGGNFYWFDATYQADFDLHIKGTSTDWIYNQASPPILFPLPNDAGEIFAFVQVTEGGSFTLENVLCSGMNAVEGGDPVGNFMSEVGATKMIVDNCAFSDMQNNVMEINSAPDLVSITNCIMINGLRTTNSPWGGHLGRFNTPGPELIIENNTYVNSGRLLGNGGNFYTTDFIENHNTWLNSQTNAQNLHWRQGLMANNIFWNWSYMGATLEDVAYNYSITTFETFSGLALDSVSLYFGINAMYRDPAIKQYYDDELPDSLGVYPYILWNLDVDSTINADDNFTIGKNYWDIDPEFATEPGNLDKMLEWVYYRHVGGDEWPDWRITSAVTYDDQGQPVVSWPPPFDLSYTNQYLLVGATDGLPVGDLNWFPEAKATYLANRDAYIAALEDSITNATYLYIPGDSLSARITIEDLTTSVETSDLPTPNKFSLAQNYPNPFNPTTSITYSIGTASDVKIELYNALGQKVQTLFNEHQASGKYKLTLDASGLASGVYFYSIKAGDFKDTKKMLFMK